MIASRHRSNFTRGRGYMTTGKTVRQLREMGEHILIAAKNALKEGVDEIIADAKNRAPRRTGKLQESIKAVSRLQGAEYELQANAPALNKRGIPYGQFVEFDPRIGGKPNEGVFLYPAMRANRGKVDENVKKAIRDAINRGH